MSNLYKFYSCAVDLRLVSMVKVEGIGITLVLNDRANTILKIDYPTPKIAEQEYVRVLEALEFIMNKPI